MRRIVFLVCLGFLLAVAFTPQANAQVVDPTTLHYVCTGTTVCTAGATTLITGSSIPTFNITIQGQTGLTPPSGGGTATGTLYIVVLVPSTAPALSFSINGTAAVSAGVFSSGVLYDSGTSFFAASHFATANPNFSAYASASGQSGTTPTGFDVYVATFSGVTVTVNQNGVAQGVQALITVGAGGFTGLPAGGFPVGTVFMAALSDGVGGSLFLPTTTVINTNPLSEGITIVPEPGTMALFGSGLLALAGAVRRRLKS